MKSRFKKLSEKWSKNSYRDVLQFIWSRFAARGEYFLFRARILLYEFIKKFFIFRPPLDLQGWFSEENQKSLCRIIDSLIIENNLVESVKVLEIGTWKGLSTSVICGKIKKLPGSFVVCVDHWKYSEDTNSDFERLARARDVFSIFKRNMEILDFEDMVLPFFGSSENLGLFSSQSFDLVFIDGDHRYTPFIRDLVHALRLIKPGGIICGDDGEMSASHFEYEFLFANREKDFAYDQSGRGCHPGVVLGLDQIFGDAVSFENENRNAYGAGHNFWWIKADDWAQFKPARVNRESSGTSNPVTP